MITQGREWSKEDKIQALTGAMELMVFNPTAANASDKNGRVLISQLKDYLMGQLPPDPEGVQWVTAPQVSYEDSTVTIGAGEANWNGVATTYSGTVFPVTLPAQGLIRRDLFAAKSDGTYVYVDGPEGSVAIDPALPAGTLFVRYILFSAQGGVVEQPPAGALITPYPLTDATTVQVDGTKSVNFVLNLPATPQIQTLSFVNTEHGGDYRVVINNCSGQTVTIGAVSGVAYTDYRGNVRTTLTLPASGKCVILYYHESASVRQVVTLDEATGQFLKLLAPEGSEAFGGDPNGIYSQLTLLAERAELYQGDGTNFNGFVRMVQGLTDLFSVNKLSGRKVSAGLLLNTNTLTPSLLVELKVETAADSGTYTTHTLEFRQDGKLYINGAEFSGGSGGSGITQAQLDAAIATLRPTSLTTFTATNTFNANKVMKLGGTGDAFSANHVLTEAASGNLMDTTLTVIVTGNGTNTVSVAAGWLNENGGTFDATSGKKNVFRLHYIDANNKFFTITQPA